VTIEEGAVVGGGATVVPGCTMGKNSVLGAGSVLTKSIPENEVWAGNPAKHLMSRAEYEARREAKP